VIAKLRGRLDAVAEAHAVIDVGGVGYLVFASSRTLAALGSAGGDVTLHTEMLVAQDMIRLVGFGSAAERDWFRLLTGVQGVGSKVALAILSALPADDLAKAVGAGDHRMVAQAQGVGPKLAQRIVNELQDKAGGFSPSGGGGIGAAPLGRDADDAVSALLNLGFRPPEARDAVGTAQQELGSGASLDQLVRSALKRLTKP
jgi:Holliday junction DNA helicase RuvA